MSDGQERTQAEFADVISQVARTLLHEPDVHQTLQGIVDLAALHLEGEVWVSISLVHARRRVDTPVSTDDRAVRADLLQYELEQGPCLDAIWEQETFSIPDFGADTRYPDWSRRVLEETGIHSSLSFQLFTSGNSLGALNLYSGSVEGFDARSRAEGLAFAAQAAVALRSAQQEEHMQAALDHRSVIGQAQGILMERYKVSSEQAFAILRRASQHTNVRLHEVAQQLVDTGVTPNT